MTRRILHGFMRPAKGQATLFIAVILVVLVTLSSLYTFRSVFFSQKDSSNHYWAAQTHEAAQAGVEYALGWLVKAYAGGVPNDIDGPVWQNATAADCPPGYSTADWRCLVLDPSPDAQATVLAQHQTDVRLVRSLLRPHVVKIRSLATHAANQSEAEIWQDAYLPFGAGGGAQPPLLVNGCTAGFKATPIVCPENATGASCVPPAEEGGTVGVALQSLYVPDTSGDGVVSGAEREACLPTGSLNLNGGSISYSTTAQSNPAPACNRVWNTVFGSLTKAQIKAISDAQAAAGLSETTTPRRTVYWVDSSAPWHQSLGAPTASNPNPEPVILVFSAQACATECPKINGSPTIYGTIYMDTGCDSNRVNGWGGAIVYGTLAVDSGIKDLNANVVFHHWAPASGAIPQVPPGTSHEVIQRAGGSWKDWSQP